MRIIDSQYDYYDHLQSYTDPIVFDRRGSRVLTKEDVCKNIADDVNNVLLLLHCGATYWLILATITERTKNMWGGCFLPNNYELKLLDKWVDHSVKRELITFDVVFPHVHEIYKNIYKHDVIEELAIKNIDKIKNAIHTNDYGSRRICSEYKRVWDYKANKYVAEYHPPLLKACGISSVVEPFDIFLAIEEHFSMLKTEAERTEPLGATNDDKIIIHGFDTKTSFRRKR